MVVKILSAAEIQHAETLFPRGQPEGVFAVYGDRISADGSDERLSLLEHDVTVELYEPAEWAGREERDRLIDVLDEYYEDGLVQSWDCEMRVWLEDVRLFLTTYHFSYLERR